MDDFEMIKKCAEKMGLSDGWMGSNPAFIYDPLHDDAQAMALVKKLRLMIWTETAYWLVSDSECEDRFRSMNTDLNRAIVECVSKIV